MQTFHSDERVYINFNHFVNFYVQGRECGAKDIKVNLWFSINSASNTMLLIIAERNNFAFWIKLSSSRYQYCQSFPRLIIGNWSVRTLSVMRIFNENADFHEWHAAEADS